jgi:mannan endo-1,4-beta-mannosidase
MRALLTRSAAALVALLVLTACSDPSLNREAILDREAMKAPYVNAHPYDVRPLLHPKKEYIGVSFAFDGPTDLKPTVKLQNFTKAVGKAPNMLKTFQEWGGAFDKAEAKEAWAQGAIPFIDIEPFKPSLKVIAAGGPAVDRYIEQYATAIKSTNVPVAYSFGHEFNGDWYEWGHCYANRPKAQACAQNNTAKDFVAAWKHIHEIFERVGAGNVIWVWSPNTIKRGLPGLSDYYPGDAYVDWVGLSGYMTPGPPDPQIFNHVFKPTMDQVRTFSQKPFVMTETASNAGARKLADIKFLFKGVYNRPDILGFIWFDVKKPEGDYRLSTGRGSVKAFKTYFAYQPFGFDPRTVSGS